MSDEEKRQMVRRRLIDNSKRVSAARNGFDHRPDYMALKRRQAEADRSGIRNPYFDLHEGIAESRTVIEGRPYLNFTSYNYLGLSGDPAVRKAAKDAIDRYGTTVSASRLVSGDRPIHRDLERALADLIGAEDGVVFASGYAANVAAIGYLFGPRDLVLHDALIHQSVMDGVELAGAARLAFPHNDWEALEAMLSSRREDYDQALIVVEGVYSMDGDIPDLNRLIDLKNRYHALLMVDEAHSMGVIGQRGFGIREYCDIAPDAVDIWMGTLSKSFASCGGYIAGSGALVELLKYQAPGFIFSVGMPPPVAGAALAAVHRLREEPERVRRLQERARLFLETARASGLSTGRSRDSAVIPVMIGDSLKSLQIAQALFEKGINVNPILHPAVDEHTSRLRFFITCLHTEEDIQQAVEATVGAISS